MPAPRHFRLTYSGNLGPAATPVEEFSFGLSCIASPTAVHSIGQMKEAAAALFPLFGTHLAPHIRNTAQLTRCRMALINDQGKTERTAAGAYIHGDATGSVAGGGTTQNVPFQIAAVVSLESEFSGPTGRGRFYLPVPILQVDLDGRWLNSNVESLETAALNFVNAVNSTNSGGGGVWGEPADGIIGRVCVASAGSALKGIAPQLRPIVRVGVGRTPDTQRRRRNDLDDTKTFQAVA